jgi:hypothetical protein
MWRRYSDRLLGFDGANLTSGISHSNQLHLPSGDASFDVPPPRSPRLRGGVLLTDQSRSRATNHEPRIPGWAAIGTAAAGTALILALWASQRALDGDEGFYLAAGRHVVEGQRLYADVFYPQMPYLPWVEAIVFRFFGVSLAAGRMVSIAAASIAAALLAGLVWRLERSSGAALIAAVLYVAHGPSLHMLSLAKTYGLASLLLLAAVAPLALGGTRRPRWALMAGVAAGLAIGVRLPAAAVAFVLAFLAWRQGHRPFLAFACGGLVGSLGWLLAAATSPEHFWFCNVTFHSLRREITGLGPILIQKIAVIAKWLLLPQHLVAWALVGAALWKGPRRWPATCCLVALALTLAAATPTYLQYMVHFFPFVLLAAGPALARIALRPVLTALVVGVYLLGLYPAVQAVPAENPLAEKRQLWDRRTVFDVVRFIRAHTGENDAVLSWWEGYPVLSGRRGFIGVGFWESNVAKKLTPELARRYHVLRQEEVRALIDARAPRVIVTTSDNWRQHRTQIDAGYRLEYTAANIEVYLRREGAAPRARSHDGDPFSLALPPLPPISSPSDATRAMRGQGASQEPRVSRMPLIYDQE